MKSEISKYKLERKNTYVNYTVKGLTYLGSAASLTGMSSFVEDVPKDTIINIVSNEVLIVTFIVILVSLIKTLPITKEIMKLKTKNIKKKI